MKKRMLKRNRHNNLILEHIKDNLSVYFISMCLFLFGIIIGIILVNNRETEEISSTSDYINNSILNYKEKTETSKIDLFKSSIKKNLFIIFIIWLLGISYLGKYFLYIVLIFLGLTFGYTSSAILSTLQVFKGILLLLSSTLLQNLIAIPCILFLIAEGIRLQNHSITYNYSRKIIIKYSAICFIITILLTFSTFIESFVSLNLMYKISKFL